MTTASSPDDAKTPESTSLAGFHFHIDDNPVAGPVGPHLFHLKDSFKRNSFPEPTFEKNEPMSPSCNYASNSQPEGRGSPVPNHVSQPVASWLGETEVENWSPQHVVVWMHQLGFDEEIIEKFFINDISGSILLELQPEDLKELDIQSFGKRHRLLGCIRQLKNNETTSQTSHTEVPAEMTTREVTATPQTNVAEVGVSYNESSVTSQKSDSKTKKEHRHRRHKRRHDVAPEDSVSIVAIEQLLPKRHTCSKGENCPKWQKQQAKLARLANGLPIESLGGSIILTGDPGNAASAQTLVKTPKSEVTPSLVASSDALGPNQGPASHLSENALNNVQPRDPQENVRNFLNFQRLSRLQPANNPPSPPGELLPSPETDSPGSTKTNLSENLRHLPKLRIPSTHSSAAGSTLSPNYSAQRTITPSMAQKQQLFAQQAPQKSPTPWSSLYSPGDFYRVDPHYGQATPFSEMDVPITPAPWGPVARDASQSVPPNMRFGGQDEQMADPIPRPASTKAENHRRNPTFHRTLDRLDEGQMLQPIETPEDLEKTPRAAHCRNNPFSPTDNNASDVTHSGWMKKRKNTRLLRHYWEDHHFTLKGTQLNMHADEQASQRDSKALECIDVDDYAVACSSLPSNSKLTAAFKKTLLKRKDDNLGDAAFAFSLVPSPHGNNGQERKVFFLNGPKSHHFAVKTRDERIDWMRELMLAKALRRGRESGASVKVNGGDVL